MGRETINAEVKFYFYKRFSWVKVIQSVNYSLPPAYLEISGGGGQVLLWQNHPRGQLVASKLATFKIPPTVRTIL